MNFDSFFSDLIATLLGGVGLAFLFFLAREKLFPIGRFSGQWYVEMETVNTKYNPYKGMVLRYIVIVWREGNLVKGSAEKIYERSSTGERNFVGKHRTRAFIEGYVEKKYFGKDRIFLHSIENGHGRESTNCYDLVLDSDFKMSGTFYSMVANQDGIVKCQREPF